MERAAIEQAFGTARGRQFRWDTAVPRRSLRLTLPCAFSHHAVLPSEAAADRARGQAMASRTPYGLDQ